MDDDKTKLTKEQFIKTKFLRLMIKRKDSIQNICDILDTKVTKKFKIEYNS
jgi:hypothetical protein